MVNCVPRLPAKAFSINAFGALPRINDNAQRATYLKHDGVTARKLWDGKAFADLGSYTAYQNASESPVSGTYSLTVNTATRVNEMLTTPMITVCTIGLCMPISWKMRGA